MAMSQQLSMIALLGTVSLTAACSSDPSAAGTGGGGSDSATAEGGMVTGHAASTDGAADSGADSAPAMTARACDDNLKALDLGAGAAVTLVKAFTKGEVLSLTSAARASS